MEKKQRVFIYRLQKLSAVVMAVLLIGMISGPLPAAASEMDILLDKLVEKGVLTRQDASAILQETRKAAEKERRETVQATKEALMKDGGAVQVVDLPGWIKNTKFKGDFRLRYEYTRRHASADRHRGRYRLRLGFVTDVTDRVEVGFGLASGEKPDHRSTNETMGDLFESDDLWLDYAYAQYRPFDWLTLLGGKFKNPLWLPSGLLFDSDIRPEGAAAVFSYSASSAVELFAVAGYWIIDEEKSSEDSDATMTLLQAGSKIKLGERAYFKNAAAVYDFRNVEGSDGKYLAGGGDGGPKTNTVNRDKTRRHDYDAYVLSGELGMDLPLDLVPFCALYGEYINNFSASRDDDGYIFGVKFGDKKVSKPHQWQVNLNYRRLERDAWVDFLPDADTYGGDTNVRSYQAGMNYGLLQNVSLGMKYYYSKLLKGPSLSEDKFQLDMMFKF